MYKSTLSLTETQEKEIIKKAIEFMMIKLGIHYTDFSLTYDKSYLTGLVKGLILFPNGHQIDYGTAIRINDLIEYKIIHPLCTNSIMLTHYVVNNEILYIDNLGYTVQDRESNTLYFIKKYNNEFHEYIKYIL